MMHLPLRAENHGAVNDAAYPDWTLATVRDRRNVCVASVGGVDRATEGTAEAYARLFAAAPGMLDRCARR